MSRRIVLCSLALLLISVQSRADGLSPGRIGNDFKDVLTTKESLWILGAGLCFAAAVHPMDDNIADSKLGSELDEDTALDHFFEVGQVLGGGVVQVGGAFATYGLGSLLKRPAIEQLGVDLVRAQVVTQSMTYAIKLGVGRERPDGSNARSFPSGHSSGSFSTATVLQRTYGWKVGLPAYGAASYVALSRLSEQKHYLSDVVFGAAIGIAVGRLIDVQLPYTPEGLSIRPVIDVEGFGLLVTR